MTKKQKSKWAKKRKLKKVKVKFKASDNFPKKQKPKFRVGASLKYPEKEKPEICIGVWEEDINSIGFRGGLGFMDFKRGKSCNDTFEAVPKSEYDKLEKEYVLERKNGFELMKLKKDYDKLKDELFQVRSDFRQLTKGFTECCGNSKKLKEKYARFVRRVEPDKYRDYIGKMIIKDGDDYIPKEKVRKVLRDIDTIERCMNFRGYKYPCENKDCLLRTYCPTAYNGSIRKLIKKQLLGEKK